MAAEMEEAAGEAEAAPPGSKVLSFWVGDPARRDPTAFILQVGDVLRLGRAPANDLVVDLDGVSGCHLELFLKVPDEIASPAGGGEDAVAGSADPELFLRDISKNGTAVRQAGESWRALPRGGLARLGDGWQLLLPARGRPKGAEEVAHTLTVRLSAPDGPGDGVSSIKPKTPRRRARHSSAAKEKRKRPAGEADGEGGALEGEAGPQKHSRRRSDAAVAAAAGAKEPRDRRRRRDDGAEEAPPEAEEEEEEGAEVRDKKRKRKRRSKEEAPVEAPEEVDPGSRGPKHKKHRKDKEKKRRRSLSF